MRIKYFADLAGPTFMCNFSRIPLVTYFHRPVKIFFKKISAPVQLRLSFLLSGQPGQKSVSGDIDIVKDFVGQTPAQIFPFI
jgi:hypothetical protein